MLKSILPFVGAAMVMSLSSCSGPDRIAYSDGVLNISSLMSHDIGTSFDAIGYGSKIVSLETTENSLLPNNSHVAFVTGTDVFITGRNRLYRFAMDGSFKNTVGTIGQGPMEYSQMHNVSFNEDSSLVNIYDGNRKMLVWSMDSKPVKEVNLASDGYISAAYALSDGYWAEIRDMENDKVSYGIVWFDAEGQQMAKKELFSFRNAEAVSYFTAPIVKQLSDNHYFYYDAFSSAGYEITDHGINKIVDVDYGKFRAENEKLNDMSYRETYRDNFCEVLDFSYNDNDMMLLIVKGDTFRGALIDNTSGSCIFSHDIDSPRKNGGIEIWEDCKLRLWPSYSRNGIKYGLIETSEIGDDILKRNNVGIIQNYEANPCLVIIEKS